MTFREKLLAAQGINRSWLCVGLDPAMARLPQAALSSQDPLLTFARTIVESTADVVCAYKPNLGFWLAEGPAGMRALQQIVKEIPEHLPIILDAKFNDVGHTAEAYAQAAFATFGVDAVTASPYLGLDPIRSFLAAQDRGVFLLARTSNPSAPDIQDLEVNGEPLYRKVAQLASRWQNALPGTCGLVVGATYPDELSILRELAPDLPFLIPGIGAQGGDLSKAVAYGPAADGIGPVINSSRGIIYASAGSDFGAAARTAAVELRDRINQEREAYR